MSRNYIQGLVLLGSIAAAIYTMHDTDLKAKSLTTMARAESKPAAAASEQATGIGNYSIGKLVSQS
jgi:hypothetical protein